MGQVSKDVYAAFSLDGSSLVDQAKDMATQVTREATDKVSAEVSRQKEQSAVELNELASAIRDKGDELGDGIIGPVVGKVADQIESASKLLMDARLKDVVRATERFARREPALFLGAAFTAGLLVARFIKSSAAGAIEEEAGGDEISAAPVTP